MAGPRAPRMAIVIDASIAIAWCLRDRPGTPYADAAVEEGSVSGITVPSLFWHEVRHVLLVGERQGRVAVGGMDDHVKDLRKLLIETDGDQIDGQVAALARHHNLSGYDAAYLETTMRRRAKLATLDKKLASAAADEGVAASEPA